MKTIEEYSLQSFIRHFGCSDKNMFDGCMVSHTAMQTGYGLPFFRMNECLILLCVEGEMQVGLNGQEYTLLSHSLLVCPSNSILQMECYKTCTFICMIPTSDYLNRHYNYWKQILPLLLEIKGKNVIPLTEVEVLRYENISSCVLECMRCGSQPGWTRDALSSGMKMLLCAIFAKFMVKKVSGKTPGKWIDEVVMEEIDYLLRNSTISIKEIAYQMNFANISFFGKFVKRYTGVSPHHYRTMNVKS